MCLASLYHWFVPILFYHRQNTRGSPPRRQNLDLAFSSLALHCLGLGNTFVIASFVRSQDVSRRQTDKTLPENTLPGQNSNEALHTSHWGR